MSKKIESQIPSSSSLVIEFPDLPDTIRTNRDPNIPSIRQIILTGLREGRNTPSIAAVIRQYHPDSAAAAKSSKHIAYYRSLMKKESMTA